MKQKHFSRGCLVALGLALVLVSGFSRPARAATEDAALFYDELTQYGTWTEYEDYGPVWRPDRVEVDWRPYLNGRWVPTEQGYVFETQEPWGWATYHYGNWMPTENMGWVWAPGRTWYPNTVVWRTSPENAPVDTSYVGWAPIPPPNYVPPPAYYPPGGYTPGTPVLDLITSPFYLFVQAASFLLGFGQPFIPAYSYYGCGCLAPPAYYPMFFPSTVIVSHWCYPAYYPRTFVGLGLGAGVYGWGPSFAYVSRITHINQVMIHNYVRDLNVARIHNVMVPGPVLARHPGLHGVVPPALAQGMRLPPPQRAMNLNLARSGLARPDLVRTPQGLPRLQAGQIPRGIGGSWGTSQAWPGGHPDGMANRSAGGMATRSENNHFGPGSQGRTNGFGEARTRGGPGGDSFTQPQGRNFGQAGGNPFTRPQGRNSEQAGGGSHFAHPGGGNFGQAGGGSARTGGGPGAWSGGRSAPRPQPQMSRAPSQSRPQSQGRMQAQPRPQDRGGPQSQSQSHQQPGH
jgi:hypothetical protein